MFLHHIPRKHIPDLKRQYSPWIHVTPENHGSDVINFYGEHCSWSRKISYLPFDAELKYLVGWMDMALTDGGRIANGGAHRIIILLDRHVNPPLVYTCK